ncbi:MAG: PEGA domain-containing protein [Methanoregulaceae archaeon]
MDNAIRNLVAGIVILSIAGAVAGTGYYYAVVLPQEKPLQAPTNDLDSSYVQIPPPVLPGNIQVWTTPGNSYVCVDGTACKATTNSGSALFTGLASDTTHMVTVSLDGYAPYSKTVLVTPQNTTEVDAIMTPLNQNT